MEVKTLKVRIVLIGAIGVALGMVILPKVSRAIRSGSSDTDDYVSVLVADRYIPTFTVISPQLVRSEEFPKHLVPPGALRDKAELRNAQNQCLFTSAVALPEGQPLTRSFVTDAAQNDALGSLIRPGKVAVSFEVDKAHGVGGWIRPGDTVAVFGKSPVAHDRAGSVSKMRLLLSSVIVLAIDDQRLGQGEKKLSNAENQDIVDVAPTNEPRVLTVLVHPAEATQLIEAREEGNLSVVLRSLGDDVSWNAAQ